MLFYVYGKRSIKFSNCVAIKRYRTLYFITTVSQSGKRDICVFVFDICMRRSLPAIWPEHGYGLKKK